MFQTFYTDTLASRFIKSLLAQTPLPTLECVCDGDFLIKDCYYVYKRYIIRCHTSGILKLTKQDQLYPSPSLYPSVFLFPGTGIQLARFYVISLIDFEDPKITSVYKSSTNVYDTETHMHLKRYLRYLLSTTDLNLFPYYNCYCSKYLPDLKLSTNSDKIITERVKKQTHKVVAVPISFGRKYKIAVDCSEQVLMRACLYSPSGFIDEETVLKYSPELVSALNSSGMILNSCKFSSPTNFSLEVNSNVATFLEKNVYLVIQLPINNNSSIVVLENMVEHTGIRCNEKSVQEFNIVNHSLLATNSRMSYAFSDRLIEYLLNNIIHSKDNFPNNIKKIQNIFSSLSSDYLSKFVQNRATMGVWDSDLTNNIFSVVQEYSVLNDVYDQDGNVNKDVEQILVNKGVNY